MVEPPTDQGANDDGGNELAGGAQAQRHPGSVGGGLGGSGRRCIVRLEFGEGLAQRRAARGKIGVVWIAGGGHSQSVAASALRDKSRGGSLAKRSRLSEVEALGIGRGSRGVYGRQGSLDPHGPLRQDAPGLLPLGMKRI